MDERTKELAEKMRAGCQDAFDEIYRREAERLYRVAFMISGNPADSEDILQETFVQCYLHRSDSGEYGFEDLLQMAKEVIDVEIE